MKVPLASLSSAVSRISSKLRRRPSPRGNASTVFQLYQTDLIVTALAVAAEHSAHALVVVTDVVSPRSPRPHVTACASPQLHQALFVPHAPNNNNNNTTTTNGDEQVCGSDDEAVTALSPAAKPDDSAVSPTADAALSPDEQPATLPFAQRLSYFFPSASHVRVVDPRSPCVSRWSDATPFEKPACLRQNESLATCAAILTNQAYELYSLFHVEVLLLLADPATGDVHSFATEGACNILFDEATRAVLVAAMSGDTDQQLDELSPSLTPEPGLTPGHDHQLRVVAVLPSQS